ncbi:MAG TPA: HAD family hydrolase, partial [Herpetosiphonaceae bacterium]
RRREPTLNVARQLGLPATLICHNGARIWDEAGTELAHRPLDMAVARKVAEIGDRRHIPFVFTVDEVNYFNPRSMPTPTTVKPGDKAVLSLHDALRTAPTRIVGPGLAAATALIDLLKGEQEVHMFQYSRPDGEIYSAIAAHPDATKENALAMLCGSWDVPAANVLAIGDAEADAGMLRWAGVGVAPKGSMPQAIAAANWIAPSAKLGGLAVAVHRYVLNGAQRR